MTPAPISVERLRELLAAALDRAQRASRPHHNSGATSFDASVEYVTAFAEVRTQHAALLQQLAEMLADLEREQGVREDAQRQLRAAERARDEAFLALREIAEYKGDPLTPIRNSVKKSAIARAFLAASGGNADG